MNRDWAKYEEARIHPAGRVVMRQRWEHLLFLHWPVPPATVAATLPPGLTVDCFDGKAWVGIVPFWMRGVRPTGLPAVPGLSNFHELNLRTYVRDAEDRPGVWFYSLDCDQPLAVAVARRFFHLPYEHARMASAWDGQTLRYECARRGLPETSVYLYEPQGTSAAAKLGTLDYFLIERYRLFSWNARRKKLFSGRVWHQPYRIQPVNLVQHDTAPFGWNGFPPPSAPPVHTAYSAGVKVEIFALEKAVETEIQAGKTPIPSPA